MEAVRSRCSVSMLIRTWQRFSEAARLPGQGHNSALPGTPTLFILRRLGHRRRMNMLDPETEAFRQRVRHPLPVADMGIRFEAEQGAPLLSGDFGGAQKVELGFRRPHALLDDAPEQGHVAATGGQSAFLRRAKAL